VTIEGVGTLSPAPAASGAAVVPGALDAEPCALTSGSWGEPLRGAGAVAACVGARPLVHVRGAATRLVGPARFQGTLLVDGDLVVEGAVRGAGIVVVRGGVDATAGMLVLDGALVAGGPVRLGGGSEVRASRCAVAAAAGYTARPVPLTRRAWAEVLR
jgi:formylmethanofuran dehydrogenase subunit C